MIMKSSSVKCEVTHSKLLQTTLRRVDRYDAYRYERGAFLDARSDV